MQFVGGMAFGWITFGFILGMRWLMSPPRMTEEEWRGHAEARRRAREQIESQGKHPAAG
jgi:hypothetical protein